MFKKQRNRETNIFFVIVDETLGSKLQTFLGII